jgi:hypothetical protein
LFRGVKYTRLANPNLSDCLSNPIQNHPVLSDPFIAILSHSPDPGQSNPIHQVRIHPLLSTSIQSHPDLSSIHPIQAHPILDQSTPVRSRLVLFRLSIPVRSNPAMSGLIPTYSRPIQFCSSPFKSCPNQSSPVEEALRLHYRAIHYCPDLYSPIQATPILSKLIQSCSTGNYRKNESSSEVYTRFAYPSLSSPIQTHPLLFRAIHSCPDFSSPVQSLPILQTHPSCSLFRLIKCSSQTSSSRS